MQCDKGHEKCLQRSYGILEEGDLVQGSEEGTGKAVPRWHCRGTTEHEFGSANERDEEAGLRAP